MTDPRTIRLPRIPTPVLMFAIVLVLIALETLIGVQSARVADTLDLLKLAQMLILLVVAAGLWVARFEFGILFLPIIAVVVPLNFGTGTQSALVASLPYAACVVALGVVRTLARHEPVRIDILVTVPAIGFLLTTVISTLWGEVARSPLVVPWPTFVQAQLGTLGVFATSVGTLLVVMHSLRDLRWIRYLTWIFLLLGAVTIAGYLLRSRSDLPGVEIGGMFSLWVVALAYGQALFNRQMPLWGRVGLLILVAAWVVRRYFFEGFWLSGWIPIFVAIVVISLLRPRPLSFLVLGGLAVGSMLQFDSIYTTQVLGEDSAANFLRADIWSQNLELTKNHLLLGTGAAGYAPYYMTFFRDTAYASHSNYLDVFSQTGLIGSFFFAWLLISLVIVSFRARRRWSTGFAGGFAAGALGALVGLMVAMILGDWLLPFAYTQTIAGFRHTVHSWVLLGALVSLLHVRVE